MRFYQTCKSYCWREHRYQPFERVSSILVNMEYVHDHVLESLAQDVEAVKFLGRTIMLLVKS